MTKDPWTDPDPQPGDFDSNIAEMSPEDVQIVEAGSGAKVILIGDEDPDDWVRRQRAEGSARRSQDTASRTVANRAER